MKLRQKLRAYQHLTQDRLTRQMMVGIVWGGLSRGGPFIALALSARILGPQDFGLFAIVNLMVALISALASRGLQVLSLNVISSATALGLNGAEASLAVLKIAMVLAIVISAGIGLLSGPAFLLLDVDKEVAEIAPYAAFWVAGAILNLVMVGCLLGLGTNRALLRVGVNSGIASIVFVPIGAIYFGVVGAVIAKGAAVGYGVVQGALVIRSRLPVDRDNPRISWKLAAKDIVPATLGSLAWTGTLFYAVLYVSQSEAGLTAAGHFALAQQFFSAASFLPHMASRGVSPTLYHAYARRDYPDLNRSLRRSIALSLLAGAVTSIGVFGASFYLVEIFGPGYSEAQDDVMIIAVATFVASPAFFLGQFLVACRKAGMWAAIDGGSGAVLIAAVWFIPDATISLAAGFLAAFLVKVILALGAMRALQNDEGGLAA